MKTPDDRVMSNETLHTHINLMHTLLDIIDLCLNNQTDLARAVVQLTADNVLILAEEIHDDVDQR